MSGKGSPPASAADLRVTFSSSGPVVETTLRVRFAETDAMGVTYHTHYLVWFEVGRSAYWRGLHLDAVDALHDAGAFPVSAVEAYFHAPARYGDVVAVRTWVREIRSRSVTFAYECLLAANGQRLAIGQTTHIFQDAEGHARRLPDAVRRALLGQEIA